MNINQALNYYSKKLIEITKDYKIAYIEAQILLMHSLNLSKIKLISEGLRELRENEINNIEKLINRRLKYEPIAYIINKKEFYGIDFYINDDVLIPRVETEEIIDLIKEYIEEYIGKKAIKKNKIKNISVCDIGAGSGNISITLKKLFENIDITAVEISEKAIEIIKKNVKNILKNEINIIHADALTFFPKNKFDIVISNPPYVALRDKDNLQKDLNFEPKNALYSGYDGLDFYRGFFSVINKYLKSGGAFFFEIGFNQGNTLLNICESFNIKNAKIKKDLSGKDRFLICYDF